MKTILILTDFSKNARNATDVSAQIARQIGADILLLNVCFENPYIPSIQTAPWKPGNPGPGQSQDTTLLDQEAFRLTEKMSSRNSRLKMPEIYVANAEGTLTENVHNIMQKRAIALLVMGVHKKHHPDCLFVNHDLEMIKKGICPVLLIPEGSRLPQIKSLVFVTRLDPDDLTGIKLLADIFKNLNCVIHIVYVSQNDSLVDRQTELCDFRKELSRLHLGQVVFEQLDGDNAMDQVIKYSKQLRAGILAIPYKKHSFAWYLMHENSAKQWINTTQMPLLVLPESK